eukprot:11055891-Karenia_brevis.AAC.1
MQWHRLWQTVSKGLQSFNGSHPLLVLQALTGLQYSINSRWKLTKARKARPARKCGVFSRCAIALGANFTQIFTWNGRAAFPSRGHTAKLKARYLKRLLPESHIGMIQETH